MLFLSYVKICTRIFRENREKAAKKLLFLAFWSGVPNHFGISRTFLKRFSRMKKPFFFTEGLEKLKNFPLEA